MVEITFRRYPETKYMTLRDQCLMNDAIKHLMRGVSVYFIVRNV